MQNFADYINTALPDKADDKILFRNKKNLLEEMNSRAAEVAGRGGIFNQKVINDLIISEHADLKAEYAEYSAKVKASAKARRAVIGNIVGSFAYLLLLVIVFLGISFTTGMWKYTWVIMVDGVLLWIDYLLSLGIIKFVSMKRIFHIFARLLLFGAVVIFTIAAFLCVVALTDLPGSWLIVIAGLIIALLCDGIFASATHARLAILHWLLYIPIISALLFIIIGALGIFAWRIAWIIIPIAIAIDLIIAIAAIGKNDKNRMEVEDIWNEN